MSPTLVAGNGMNLIDDDGAAGAKHVPPRLRGEQNVERFGRGHEDMRRFAAGLGTLRLRRVAGTHHGADLHVPQVERRQLFANALERRLEIPVDVVRQRLQRRDIHDPGLVGQLSRDTFLDELIDRRQKRGKGLAGPRGGGHQDVFAGSNRRPSLRLRRSRRIESPREPRGNGGMKRIEYAHGAGPGDVAIILPGRPATNGTGKFLIIIP